MTGGSSEHAIYGLDTEQRAEVQSLCQSWWDSTQQDQSWFAMACSYQDYVQDGYFKSSIHDCSLGEAID